MTAPEPLLAWSGQFFLGIGRLLYVGPTGDTSPHAHHAIQVLWSPDEPLSLARTGHDTATLCRVAVIPPDVAHVTRGGAAEAWLLYLDPDSLVGRRLRAKAPGRGASVADWREAGAKLLEQARGRRPTTWAQAASIMERMVTALTSTEARHEPVHPAIRTALRQLAAGLPNGPVLPALAQLTTLSPSRLSHLFNEQVGVSVRSYVLWHRLQVAVRAFECGASITQAAHAGGFSDGAHLSRTFRRMVGVAPSDVAQVASWVIEPETI